MTKIERLAHANSIIAAVSAHGRRFFYSKPHDRTASMIIDAQGRLRIVDEQSNTRVLITREGRWRGFSYGGPLRALVSDLADYVRTGKPIRNHFGPWPESIGAGDLWGYGEDAQKVRDAVRDNPAMRPAQRA